MKNYSSREILKLLRKDGWYEVACDGDHHQFRYYISLISGGIIC